MAYDKNKDPQNAKRYERVEYTQEELDAFKNAPADDLLTGNPSAQKQKVEAPRNPTMPPVDSKAGAPAADATATALPGKDSASTKPEERPMTRYEMIENELRRKENTGRLTLALGFEAKDEKGKSEAFKYISNVLMEIKKTECRPGESDKQKLYKDLTLSTIDSILQAILDAANFRLPIDGRKLAYLVKYGDAASFQPGFRGMLYKIAELYRDVDFTAEPVFEGDEFSLADNGGYQTYTHKRKNPFEDNEAKMQGIIACLAYSTESGRHSKIATLPKSEIDQIRGKAKQDYIWKDWYFEKAKAAALKRLCKIHFATAMGLQELMQYDNEEHFTIDATPNGDKITPASSGAELQKLLAHTPAVTMQPIKAAEAKPEPMTVAAKGEVAA